MDARPPSRTCGIGRQNNLPSEICHLQSSAAWGRGGCCLQRRFSDQKRPLLQISGQIAPRTGNDSQRRQCTPNSYSMRSLLSLPARKKPLPQKNTKPAKKERQQNRCRSTVTFIPNAQAQQPLSGMPGSAVTICHLKSVICNQAQRDQAAVASSRPIRRPEAPQLHTQK